MIDPRIWVTFGVALGFSFGTGYIAGYAHKTHNVAVEEAAREAQQTTTQQITTATVQATDTAETDKLKSQLYAAQQRALSLQQMIRNAAHAQKQQPQVAATTVSCRIDDGLRNEINRDLAAD